MDNKIALEGCNLLAHFGIFSLELPSGLGLLRGEILFSVADVLFIFHNIPKAEISQV
jgi:hypothetical protein